MGLVQELLFNGNMTQCEKIIAYMQVNGSITQREAESFGVMRLASRISDLRANGEKIISESVKVKNCDGTKTKIARYRFEGGEDGGRQMDKDND